MAPGREGFSSCAPASRAHVLRHVSHNAGELWLWPGEQRGDRLPISPERSGGAQTSLRGLRSSPPYPKARAAGDGSRLLQPPGHPAGVLWWLRRSTTCDFRTESTRSSHPNRRGWPGEHRDTETETEEGDQGRSRGGHEQPEGRKSGQEGTKTPPATTELLLPQSRI